MIEAEMRRCLDVLQRSDGRYLLRLAERDHIWDDAAHVWVAVWDLWLVDIVRRSEVVYRDFDGFMRDWPELCGTRSLHGYVLLGEDEGSLAWPEVQRALRLLDAQSQWRLSAIAQTSDGPLSLLPQLPYLLEIDDARGGRTVRTYDELCVLICDGEMMTGDLRPHSAADALRMLARDEKRGAPVEEP